MKKIIGNTISQKNIIIILIPLPDSQPCSLLFAVVWLVLCESTKFGTYRAYDYDKSHLFLIDYWNNIS